MADCHIENQLWMLNVMIYVTGSAGSGSRESSSLEGVIEEKFTAWQVKYVLPVQSRYDYTPCCLSLFVVKTAAGQFSVATLVETLY